ncbi:MAG: PaaI family thioesterase [Lachnospiraceae bacterium]|nr:PaaI family thioesterase [Lachnospiraceae bacterium]
MCEKMNKDRIDKDEIRPDYEQMIRARNQANRFARQLGIQIIDMQRGYAKAMMPITKEVKNPIGSVHGGCLFTLADVVCGAAASSYGMQATTLDSSFHFLRAGLEDDGELYGTAQVIKHGKRITVLDTKISDQTGRILCTGTFTYMSIGKKF